MSVVEEYIDCVNSLQYCVHHLKEIVTKLEDLSGRVEISDSVRIIEEQAEVMKCKLEEELK